MSYLLIKISNYLGLSIVYSVFEYVDRFESCPIKKLKLSGILLSPRVNLTTFKAT